VTSPAEEPTVRVAYDVPISAILWMPAKLDEGDEYGQLEISTVGELVARQLVAAAAKSVPDVRDLIATQIRQQVEDVIAAAMSTAPDSWDSLHGMIVKEARAQLHGGNTLASPISTWIRGEILTALREQDAARLILDEMERAIAQARKARGL
jgi:hypothetical protein